MSNENLKIYDQARSNRQWLGGDAHRLANDSLKFVQEIADLSEDIVPIRFYHIHFLVISGWEAADHFLRSAYKKYHKGLQYKQVRYLLGNGLLTNEGESWLQQRKLAAPAFHKKELQKYVQMFGDLTLNQLKSWKELDKLDIHKEMMGLTLRIVGEALFGTNVDQMTQRVEEAMEFVLETTQKRIETPIKTPLWFPIKTNQVFKKYRDILDQVIYHIIKERKSTSEKHEDLLEMFMQARDIDSGYTMSEKQLKDEVMTMFLAGHETTANTLSWCIHYLSLHPKFAEDVVDEVRREVKGETPTLEEIKKLKITQMLIYESMRLKPPAWLISRRAIEDNMLGTIPIKKNTNILINIYGMHHRKKYWKEPESFRPYRFKDSLDKPPKYFIPFSTGPRVCIGNHFAMMEMQAVIATLLKKVRFEDMGVNIQETTNITLRPVSMPKLVHKRQFDKTQVG